jgi:hypothetical protein
MSIDFHCSCGAHLRVAERSANKMVLCPRCGVSSVVPEPKRTETDDDLEDSAAEPAKRHFSPRRERIAVPDEPVFDAEIAEEQEEEPAGRRSRAVAMPVRRSRWMLWVALIVFVLMLLTGSGGLAWHFFIRTPGLTDELTYMPDNFEWIGSARVSVIVQSDLYKSLKKEVDASNPEFDRSLKEVEKDLGVALADIDRLTAGGVFPRNQASAQRPSSDQEEFPFILVIKMNRKVEMGDLFHGEGYREHEDTKVGSYSVRVFKSKKMALCVPDSKTIVLGPPETLKQVLQRGKKADMTQSMKDAMKQADFRDALVMAFNFRDLIRDSLRNAPRDLLPQELGSAVAAEKLTHFWDSGIVVMRLGSNAELEVQIIGKDSKMTFSFSVKTATLTDLIESSGLSKNKITGNDDAKKHSAADSGKWRPPGISQPPRFSSSPVPGPSR